MKHGNQQWKRLSCFILALALMLSMMPVTAIAADTPKILYLKPNSNWTQANARFAAYFFGNGETWVSMTDPDGDGIYEVAVPSGYTSVIFCRMNPSVAANNWSNKWNQTGNLTVPTDGTNCYTVQEGTWDQGGGSWSTYTPPVVEPEEPAEPETITVYFRNDWAWPEVYAHYWDDPSGQGTAWPGEKMTKVGTDSGYDVYSIEIPTWATGLLFNGLENGNPSNRQQTPNITGFADGDAYYIHWANDSNQVSEFTYNPGGEGEEPVPDDYYLVGYINGADYNGQDYKFIDGKLSLRVTGDTYIYVQDSQGTEYKTDGWLGEVASATLVTNSQKGDKLHIPSGMIVEFLLTENDDGSLYLSYTAEEPDLDEPVNNVIIHYRNTNMWDKVYAYSWLKGSGDTLTGDWPGKALSEDDDHENWYTLTLSDLNATKGVGILFSKGGDDGKTPDIIIEADGEYWYDAVNGGLLTESKDTSWPNGSMPTYTYDVTLHFVNVQNWSTVKLYTWGAGGEQHGGWPGAQLSEDENGWYTAQFTYTAIEGQGKSFLYSGDGQTVDLWLDASAFERDVFGNYSIEKWVGITTRNEGKYNADIESDAASIVWPMVVDGQSVTIQYKNKDADKVTIAGTFNGWGDTEMKEQGDGVWTVTLTDLAPGVYQYKFVADRNMDKEAWYKDPLNDWYQEDNCAFLISDPTLDNNSVTIRVHYRRADSNYSNWNLFTWGTNWDGGGEYSFTVENGEAVAVIGNVDGRAVQSISMKVRKSVAGNEWEAQEGEVVADLRNIVSGTIDLYITCNGEWYENNELKHDMSWSRQLNADVVITKKINSIELDYDRNSIVIKTSQLVSDPETAFSIYRNGIEAEIIDEVLAEGSTYTLKLKQTLDLVTLHQYSIRFSEQDKFTDTDYKINTNTVYASDKFAEEFTYDGELGALWTANSTTFRVWAPTAASVSVNLYESGTDKTDDLIKSVSMTAGEDGTWYATVEGDLDGTYYTYSVNVDGEKVEVIDPYARTAGVNGKRGMVIDLDSTDPEGWASDRNPKPITKYSDAIIYELHVRDFSIDDSSGIQEAWQGKYLAFTQTGTTVDADENGTGDGKIKSGIDYLDDLGITHLHLLPVYDYGSVDETKCDNFNWGYDPVNYNLPEGSYSTDPYDGTTRVKEFKQMVKSLHDHDISVIMDVVYNHVYDAGKFSMNQIVPQYFSRVNADGSYSNGSGCGNDTASEREMVRKFIVESVLYWHQEYHIDGFRFDLVGLLDATTINEIVDTVHACCPDVIFYGEGWTLGTAVEPGNGMATQANSAETPEFAYFSDTMRNLLGGSNGTSLGFVSGLTGKEEAIRDNFMAKPGWTSNPQQIVQYASCHDNYTLVDKLILSTGKPGIDADIIKMNNLAAAIYMTSQGIPFIHAGEEFLREKLEEDGGRCENSYNASDYVNHIEWSNLEKEQYANNSAYYKGLIAFRNAHPALRLATRAEIDRLVKYTWVTNEVVMFTIDASQVIGESVNSIVVIFNATQKAAEVTLPAGDWNICIDGNNAGTVAQGNPVSSTVSVAGISAMVLTQGERVVPTETIEAVSATLLVEDMIQIRYRFQVEAENVAEYGMYIFNNLEDAETHDPSKAIQKTLVHYEDEPGIYYGYTDGIAAKEMGDSQFVVGYLKLSDGTYVYTQVLEYSPRIYAQRMVAKESTSAATRHLCNALMQYGAAAQISFDYKTEQLMNVGFAEVPFNSSVMGGYAFSLEEATEGFTTEAATLQLEGAITYRFRYTVSQELQEKDLYLEYIIMGETSSVLLTLIDGYYYGYVRGVAAKDMDETIVVKPYYLHESGNKIYGPELVYSGYEYAHRIISDSTNKPETIDLAKALVMYIDAADKAIKGN
ncbi:MAG: type I pullulanase [Oscillospiraceae bacterium]|nr:type I pullulanase [Oscillospiraceae bacterium]